MIDVLLLIGWGFGFAHGLDLFGSMWRSWRRWRAEAAADAEQVVDPPPPEPWERCGLCYRVFEPGAEMHVVRLLDTGEGKLVQVRVCMKCGPMIHGKSASELIAAVNLHAPERVLIGKTMFATAD